MERTQRYVELAEAAARQGSDVDAGDELSAYWQREAQIHATLAVAVALHELRNMLARDPSHKDSDAFIRVAGHVFTEPGE